MSERVFSRDQWQCVATSLDEHAGPCHDRWGYVIDWARFPKKRMSRRTREYLTLQHVQLDARTDNDERHLLTLCWGHHLGTGEKAGRVWSKIKRSAQAQRDYLRERYPAAAP